MSHLSSMFAVCPDVDFVRQELLSFPQGPEVGPTADLLTPDPKHASRVA